MGLVIREFWLAGRRWIIWENKGPVYCFIYWDGGHFWQGDEGYYGVVERSGGAGSNHVGVFWVGLRRVRGADDKPSLSRTLYTDG